MFSRALSSASRKAVPNSLSFLMFLSSQVTTCCKYGLGMSFLLLSCRTARSMYPCMFVGRIDRKAAHRFSPGVVNRQTVVQVVGHDPSADRGRSLCEFISSRSAPAASQRKSIRAFYTIRGIIHARRSSRACQRLGNGYVRRVHDLHLSKGVHQPHVLVIHRPATDVVEFVQRRGGIARVRSHCLTHARREGLLFREAHCVFHGKLARLTAHHQSWVVFAHGL